MELVIKIPEKAYRCAMNGTFDANYSPYTLLDIIKNGTPLPNHGRLIDISKVEFLDSAPIREYDKGWHYAIHDCIKRLNCAPTVLEAMKEGDGE